MRFQVFKNGQVVKTFNVCGAYLFGTDGTSIRRAKITFKDGMVTCQKPNSDTAGLTLLWPVEGFGRILLSTTCLPPRDRPYCLNLEIARARLMHTISRREEWSMFEGASELEEISRQAHDLFVRAVQTVHDPAQASVLADKSLRKAMVFSEKLATTQAEAMFKLRMKGSGFGRACIGMQTNMNLIENEAYVDHLAQVGDFALVPMSWRDIEKQDGVFDFSRVDQCVETLTQKKMLLGAGPLLHFSQESLPQWLLRSRINFEKVRDLAYRFVTTVVSRYRRGIHRWFIISGLNAENHLGFSVEQVLEMTRAANMAVKAVNSRAFKIIEVIDCWGEYYATTPNSIAPVADMDMVIQSGIAFEAFALRMRFGKDEMGMHIRDMMQISSRLDYFSLLGKALYITGVEIPSENGPGPWEGCVAGVWHNQWDSKRQALWLDQFYGIVLSKPVVDAVVYGNLSDNDHSAIANSGLVTEALEPKDGYRAVKRLREMVRSRS